MTRHPLPLIALIALLTTLFTSVCPDYANGSDKLTISGRTMGTTYHITCYPSRKPISAEALKKIIDTRLERVNQSMSMYSRTSELSSFNRLETTDLFRASSDFRYVLGIGRELFLLTGGAWDGTVKPLVDLWGFGTKRQVAAIPDQTVINHLLDTTGFEAIAILGSDIRKTKPQVMLDLGSIAKGFGVDAVAGLLASKKITDFIVEIGGEVITSGTKPHNDAWTVGISKPDKDGNMNRLYKIVHLNNKAMATSGDYRNFIEIDGKIFSHIIDPVTGYPVSNGVVSVSVISDTCTFADGLATALMVMGTEKGILLVNELKGTECLMVVRDPAGRLIDYESTGFRNYVQQ